MPFPKPAEIRWHSVYFICSIPAQDKILKVNYLYLKKPKERGKKKKERKKEQENCNFCVAVLHISAFLTKKIFYSSFIFENFICALPLEDDIIDLFKIFMLNYNIKIDTRISESCSKQYARKVCFEWKVGRAVSTNITWLILR